MTLATEQRTLRLIKQSTHTCPTARHFILGDEADEDAAAVQP